MKKFITALLSVAMLAMVVLPTAAIAAPIISYGAPSPSSTDEVAPDPKIVIDSVIATRFKAGDAAQYKMNLKTQMGSAYDVRMRLKGPEGYESNFSFYTSTGWSIISDSLYVDPSPVSPFVLVSGDTPDGTYNVTVEFEYRSRTNETYTCTDVIKIVVHGKSENALQIDSAKFAKAKIGSDNKSKLTVNLVNKSSYSYSNIAISLNTGKSEGFSLYENFNPVSIPSMAAGTSAKANFSVYVNSSVQAGNYPMVFDITYQTSGGEIRSEQLPISVEVDRSADATGKGNTPRIIVEKYSTDVDEIKAGQSFTLDFTLKNTSANVTVSNIKIVVSSVTTSGSSSTSSSSAVFFPSEGSNSFFVDNILPQGTTQNQIKLMAKQDVEPGVYAVLLQLNYEDENGNPLTSEEQISFSVTQEQRLEIQSMNIPTDLTGTTLPISFQYINKGKATIYNLSVSVEGDFIMEGGSQYIGNLTAGYNDYFDNVATTTGEGPLKGTLVLKYEDSSGNELENRTDFNCNVTQMSIDMNMGGDIGTIGPDMGMQPESGVKWYAIAIPVVIVLIAAGIVTVVLLKKKKAKKAMVDDEDD